MSRILNTIFSNSPSARAKVGTSSGYVIFRPGSAKNQTEGLVVNNKTGESFAQSFATSLIPMDSQYLDLDTVVVLHTNAAFKAFLSGQEASKSLDVNLPSTRYTSLANSGENFSDVTVYTVALKTSELSAGL